MDNFLARLLDAILTGAQTCNGHHKAGSIPALIKVIHIFEHIHLLPQQRQRILRWDIFVS